MLSYISHQSSPTFLRYGDSDRCVGSYDLSAGGAEAAVVRGLGGLVGGDEEDDDEYDMEGHAAPQCHQVTVLDLLVVAVQP